MKERSLVIGGIISLIVIIAIAVILAIIGPNIKVKKQSLVNTVVEEPIEEQEKVEEPLVAVLEKREKKVEAEEAPQIRDAATITQDLQEMNANIGALYIPKTGLSTEIYCKQDANKMEEVPCMLYTNEGPNKPGVTVLVGHNRDNGLLFSNNNMLEENDEFYIKDYINNEEKTYKVYSKSVKKNDDVSFYNTPSDKPIIIMQCCLTPTDSENVLIIMAQAEN